MTDHKPKIEVHGRRWFQRGPGNTYHSVRVIVDGKEVGRVAFAYGYGDQYRQTAHKLLQKAGVYPATGARLASGADADYTAFYSDVIERREDFTFTVEDVVRKRDLVPAWWGEAPEGGATL